MRVIVQFIRPRLPYSPGTLAGFSAEEAAELVRLGYVKIHGAAPGEPESPGDLSASLRGEELGRARVEGRPPHTPSGLEAAATGIAATLAPAVEGVRAALEQARAEAPGAAVEASSSSSPATPPAPAAAAPKAKGKGKAWQKRNGGA